MIDFPSQSKYIPIGLEVYSRIKDPEFPTIPAIELVGYGRQIDGGWEYGDVIMESRLSPLSANMLDYFLDRPGLIPPEWKGKLVCFWGTIYKAKHADEVIVAAPAGAAIGSEKKSIERDILYVRFLYFSGGRWLSDSLEVNDQFGPTRLSAEIAGKKTWWQRLISILK